MKEHVPGSNVRSFFVYGTLRPGFANARLWHDFADAAWDGRSHVVGYKLVTNGGFPYLVHAEGETSTGCLITPHRGEAANIRRRFDALEGYPRHYDRIVVPVFTPAGSVRAWTYIPADLSHVLGLPDVGVDDDGVFDFNLHRREAWT